MATNKNVIVVVFNDGSVYTFGSRAAIYDRFSNTDIGCDVRQLYSQKLPYRTQRCAIHKTELVCKKQNY